jgi:P2 family phage major capsid protein
MRTETRVAFNAYTAHLAKLNGVPSAGESFTVAPSVQQTLEKKIQESAAFLQKINMIPVTEMEGEKLGLGVSGPVASRTNTDLNDRTTRDISTLDKRGYKCAKTNYDTHIKYATLDMWAKFPNFQQLVRDQIVTRQGLDRITIGFHGIQVAAETDLATYPLLQDVNRGWLQAIREDAEDQVMDHGDDPTKIVISSAGDYKNLDSLVYDAIQMLDPWYREDPGLRAFVSRDLMHDKLFPLVDEPQDPTQKVAANLLLQQARLGGLPPELVPYFPAGTILITSYDNLSVYWQEGARRRYVKDKPERDRIENYESSNDAYVVERYGKSVLIENITTPA